MNTPEVQSQLYEQDLDGWLLFDHHHRDPIAYRILGLEPKQHITRRWYCLIPRAGPIRKLVHRVESGMLDAVEGTTRAYSTWQEHVAGLTTLLDGCFRVAMQHSPYCNIPYVSNVDGGTIDLVRSAGVEVVSSAELVQYFEARLNEAQLESHLEAGRRIDRIRAAAFHHIGESVRNLIEVTEWQISEFIREQFRSHSLVSDSGPIVGVNAHSGDPHYEPQKEESMPIQKDSFVLIDMWGKLNEPNAIVYDITWTGFCGETVPAQIERVFAIVKKARDAGVQYVKDAVSKRSLLRGFEVDDAVRNVIREAGFEQSFVHRTGHSIGRNTHGNGANMDNFETHDERQVIPWTCFSIEPGIYLPEFGIRSEVDVFVDEEQARVTGEAQESVLRLGC